MNQNDVPENWREMNLEDVCEILDNERIPLNSDERYVMKGSIPYYGANGIVDHINDHIFDEALILVAEDGGNFDDYEQRSIAYKITGKSWVNNHAHVLRVKKGFDFDFIFYSMEHKNIIPVIKGETRSKLNQAELRQIPLFVPKSIKEQQRIATIIRTIDRAIAKTNELIEKKKKIKQGLMQDLLTAGVDEIGRPHTHLKMSELGIIPDDWDIDCLGNKTRINIGQSPSSEDCNGDGNGYPFLQGNADFGILYPHPKQFCTAPTKIAKRSELLISVRAPVGDLNIADRDYCIGRGLASIQVHNQMDQWFTYYSLVIFREQLFRVMQGTTFEAVNSQDLFNLKIKVPKKTEQERIAARFKSIDNT